MSRSSSTLPEEVLLDGIGRRLRPVCAHMSTEDFAIFVRAVAMVKIKYAAFDNPPLEPANGAARKTVEHEAEDSEG